MSSGEAVRQKQSDLLKLEQRAERKERQSVKNAVQGPFQSSNNGLWKFQ